MFPWVLGVAVAVLVGGCAVAVLSFVSARRDAAEGNVEAAVRVVAGSQPPLTGKWRHGVVSPSPGLLRFRRGGPGGMRLPHRRRPFDDLPVTSVDAGNRSHPARRQFWTINPWLDVVRLSTPTATVELAADRAQLDRVIAGISSPHPA